MPPSTMTPGSQTDGDSRLIELADGRLLFRSRGRLYYIRDYPHGHQLEARLEWADLALSACIVAVVLAAWWANNWWLLLLTIPALLLPVLVERVVLAGCAEATDPMARAEAVARTPRLEFGSTLLYPGLIAVALIGLQLFRGKVTTVSLIKVALIVSALLVAFAQLWRQRRAQREREIVGEPRSPENTPIVPR